jgi:signal transduction histidine kinase
MFGDSTMFATMSASMQTTGVESMCTYSAKATDARTYSDESLATLAHELRSPLATILYALEAIPDARDGDTTTQWARSIAERQARRAVRLIDDLFDVCAGSWGKLSLHKEFVGLGEIVDGATEATDYLLTARRHRLTVSLPPEPVILHVDPLRLEQVLTNLLTNAAKFTEPGGHIRLTAEIEDRELVLRVRDNGRGMTRDLLPRVFELFLQAPELNGGGRRPGGIGLGLALVKALVELHGGSVAAYSDGPGTGSEFVVRLPAGSRDA